MKIAPQSFSHAAPYYEVEALAYDRRGLREYLRANLPKTGFVAPSLVSGIVRLVEFILIVTVGAVCALGYLGLSSDADPLTYLVLALIAGASTIGIYELAGLNRLPVFLDPRPNLSKLAAGWFTVFAIIIAGVFLIKAGDLYSRVWLVAWAVTGLFFLVAERFVTSAVLSRLNQKGQLNRRVVIVGGGETAKQVIDVLTSSQDTGTSLLGFFDDRDDDRSPADISGYKKLGNVEDLTEFARATRIDCIVVTIPATAESRLLNILNRLWVLPADIRISAYGQKLRYRPRAYSYIGNLPCLDVFDRPLGDWGSVLKSVADKMIAAVAIVALSPVMLAVALAVKLDSRGPILFRQKRYGFNNELIEVFKFRSMYVDMSDVNAAKLVTKDDPRVTRVGRFIRKASLDELPQLFNVLTGQLSLVGPRPHATKAKAEGELYETVVEGYFARHKVKPGITGWAQINGWRGETETAEQIRRRVDHDLYYIENWSLTFDLYILARTPLSLLNHERAY